MKPKIYSANLLILLMMLLLVNTRVFAQQTAQGNSDKSSKSGDMFELRMDNFDISLKAGLKDLVKTIAYKANEIAPKIVSAELKDIDKSLDLNLNLADIIPNIATDFKEPDNDNSTEIDHSAGRIKEKSKSYSKSYPIDGNDKIKLSSQYGKINISTWDRHEIKVDILIKAQAADEDEAKKLLDGVQINDSKNGDLVSFRTDIERNNNNGSWKIWNWGNGNKSRKLEIDYTVFMPAKTDLNVEESYGSISLPDLSGKVKINSSYGSTFAQNLTNPANEIEGSYGSLKVGALNGARLDYSYGSVDIDECNNLKADLSYGSFKMGTLKGAAEFDLSYVGGFKIDELANSFKKVNINASYSGVALGVPVSNNFNFDITTTYGGFNFNDDKVTLTSKPSTDGRHVSTTKNYKGHFGKDGSEAQINIHSTYGGVNFE